MFIRWGGGNKVFLEDSFSTFFFDDIFINIDCARAFPPHVTNVCFFKLTCECDYAQFSFKKM